MRNHCLYQVAQASVFDSASFDRVVIMSDSGKIYVEQSVSAEVEARRDADWSEEGCLLVSEVSKRELRLKSTKRTGADKARCWAEWKIKVPGAKSISIAAGAADIFADRMTEPFQVALGAGDVHINADLKDLDISGGAMKVQARGKIEKCSISLGKGDLSMMFEKTDRRTLRHVDLNVASGSVKIQMPSDLKIHYSVGSTMVSHVRSDFVNLGTGEALDFHLDLSIAVGTAELKKF